MVLLEFSMSPLGKGESATCSTARDRHLAASSSSSPIGHFSGSI